VRGGLAVNKTTSTRLGQILLEKGLVTTEQLDIAVKEQYKRRHELDAFDESLGVKTSLGEILIELGFIDRLQLKRGLSWQLKLRKMAIVMSFCAPLMTATYGAAAATSGFGPRPTFTASSSSVAPTQNPSFTKTSSSASSAPSKSVVDNDPIDLSSSDNKPLPLPASSASSVASSVPASIVKSSSSSSKASVFAVSSSKSSGVSSNSSGVDSLAPKVPEKITVVEALSDHVQLSWVAATDNIAVTRYKIYRDQVQIDTLEGSQLGYFDFGVAPGKTYLYGISAGDEAGNWSAIKSVFAQTASVPLDSTVGSPASSSESSVPSVVVSSSSKPATFTPTSSSSVSSKASSAAVSSSSSAPAKVSSSSSSSSSKAASTSSSSSVAAGLKTSTVAGPVSFSWTAPSLRENGSTLDITEVGGYELRYRKVADNTYTYVTINDAWTNTYNFAWLEGTYLFQIAAFDKNGLYSNFIDIAPK
jgi:hypothetical protein